MIIQIVRLVNNCFNLELELKKAGSTKNKTPIMIGVLFLVLPAFLSSNSKLKQLLTNLTIWIIIVLIILTFIYIFKE